MRILTAEAMQEVDRAAIEEFGIPSLVLMENAAIGVADAIGENYPECRSVSIFCGPGNNGGDGLAVGRHLAVRGYRVELVLLPPAEGYRGDAAVQYAIATNMGLQIEELGADELLVAPVERAGRADLVVDALFGTGLRRPLAGRFAELVELLNELPTARLAVDIPSGLSGSSAEIPGPHVLADLTVTFAAVKLAHVFPPAAAAAGEIVVADLGIPPELVERATGDLSLSTAAELAPLLGARPADSHKGDYGHVLVVGGSVGKAGAVALAARAAVRAGAGLVTAAVPAPIVGVVDGASLESMSLALAATPGGGLAGAAVEELRRAAAGKSVVALGPGLGTEAETVEAVRAAVLELPLPLVLDADGLNAFAGRADELRRRPAATVLTPHPGELGRLLETATAEVVADRLAAARRGAQRTGAVVVLKGSLTLVADPQGGVAVNPTGNAGMATGGTGDVLTGVVAALVGQGLGASAAARLGAYLHGLAGDLVADELGEAALAAGDVIEALPRAFAALGSE